MTNVKNITELPEGSGDKSRLLGLDQNSELVLVSTSRLANIHSPRDGIIAAFGDSRVEQNYFSNGTGSRLSGFAYWLEFLSGGRVKIPSSLNFGRTGDTTAEAIDRLDDVVNCTASFVVILLSSNDRGGGIPIAETIKNMQIIFEKILASGKRVVVINEPLRRYKLNEASTRANYDYRYWLSQQSSRYSGLYVLDPMPMLLDFENEDVIKDDFVDGLHPSPSGARKIGEMLAGFFETIFPPVNIISYTSDDSGGDLTTFGNIIKNPMLKGVGGVKSGQCIGEVADNWGISSEETSLSVTISSIRPNNGLGRQRIAITGNGTATKSNVVFQQKIPNDKIANGDRLVFSGYLSVEPGSTSVQSVQAQISFNTIKGVVTTVSGGAKDSQLAPSVGYKGIFCTPEIEVPPDVKDAYVFINARLLEGQPAKLDFTMGNFNLRKQMVKGDGRKT